MWRSSKSFGVKTGQRGKQPDEMIILDANILIRAILGRKALRLLEAYTSSGFRFLAPETAFAETRKHLPELLKTRRAPTIDAESALEYLAQYVESIEPVVYASQEFEARLRLRGRDEDDWPVLAAALALNCPIWTEDMDFFGTGCSVWTTKSVEIFLRAQIKQPDTSNEE